MALVPGSEIGLLAAPVRGRSTPTVRRRLAQPRGAAIRPGEFFGVPDKPDRPGDCHAWLAANARNPRIAWGFRLRYAYAIPNRAAIDAIVEHSADGAVELGAGLGYWSMLIARRGVDVLAYDIEPNTTHNRYFPPVCGVTNREWSHVEFGSPGVLANIDPRRTLFLCWPDIDDFASQALAAYRGNTLCYVGEPKRARLRATADDAFHAMLDRQWEARQRVAIPRLTHCVDSLTVFNRRI